MTIFWSVFGRSTIIPGNVRQILWLVGDDANSFPDFAMAEGVNFSDESGFYPNAYALRDWWRKERWLIPACRPLFIHEERDECEDKWNLFKRMLRTGEVRFENSSRELYCDWHKVDEDILTLTNATVKQARLGENSVRVVWAIEAWARSRLNSDGRFGLSISRKR